MDLLSAILYTLPAEIVLMPGFCSESHHMVLVRTRHLDYLEIHTVWEPLGDHGAHSKLLLRCSGLHH